MSKEVLIISFISIYFLYKIIIIYSKMKRDLEKIIKKTIKLHQVGNQSELVKFLKEDFDIEMTQSNLSIKLRKLNIIKRTNEEGESYYWAPRKNIKVLDRIADLVLSVENSHDKIIIKTYPGAASIIAQIIDERFLDKKIIGAIPGHNIIEVLPASIDNIDNLKRELSLKFLLTE